MSRWLFGYICDLPLNQISKFRKIRMREEKHHLNEDFLADVPVNDRHSSSQQRVAKKSAEMFSMESIFRTAFSKIHKLFAVDCGVLVIYDDEVTSRAKTYISNTKYDKVDALEIDAAPIVLSAMDRMIAELDFPILKSSQEWIAEFGQNHCFDKTQIDYQFHGYIPLEYQGKVYGTFELHNEIQDLSAEGLDYCSKMADLIVGLLSEEVNLFEDQPTISNNQYFDLVQEKRELENRIITLEKELITYADYVPHQEELIDIPTTHPDIIGNSERMQEVSRLLSKSALADASVLILGETGTGKELIAKRIHEMSSRSEYPLVRVNCAAIPANLIESELFGHEKGSFTGATERRIGKFEQANNGTIFLDEIGELSLDLQVKLLRVLQEKEFERVGGTKILSTNVRVISATNRELQKEVDKGSFRSDLYYRLNVFPISLPSLRERKEDIPMLAAHFVTKYAMRLNRQINGVSKKAMGRLVVYQWPGNVRELEHLIERNIVLTQGNLIRDIDMPSTIEIGSGAIAPVKTIAENERSHIFEVLTLCNGRISGPNGAAKLLGVPATTLNSKIKKLGLAKKHFFNSLT